MMMVMDRRLESFSAVRSALSLPVAPLQYLASYPIQFFEHIREVISARDDLLKENLKLKSEHLLLQAQLQRLLTVESENNALKALQGSAQQLQTKTLIAELLATSGDSFGSRVVINKGTSDGVYRGQAVLDAKGVFGQVIEVGPLTSRVLLINDPHSGVAVQSARSGVRAIAVGEGYADKLRLLYLQASDIKIGDIFVTSGLSGHYPQGYPVGKVISIMRDPSSPFLSVYLQPLARLRSSRQVLLVWGNHSV